MKVPTYIVLAFQIIVIVILSLLMFACSTLSSGTQVANIPIATKCEPTVKVTEITEYPLDTATKSMSLYEKAQLAISEISLLKGNNKELRAALSECTK